MRTAEPLPSRRRPPCRASCRAPFAAPCPSEAANERAERRRGRRDAAGWAARGSGCRHRHSPTRWPACARSSPCPAAGGLRGEKDGTKGARKHMSFGARHKAARVCGFSVRRHRTCGVWVLQQQLARLFHCGQALGDLRGTDRAVCLLSVPDLRRKRRAFAARERVVAPFCPCLCENAGDTHLDRADRRQRAGSSGCAGRRRLRFAVRRAAFKRADDGVQLAHLRGPRCGVRRWCAKVSRRGARSRGPGDSGGASSATPLGGRSPKRALRYGQRVMPNSLHRCLSTVTQTPSCGGAGGARKACVGCEGLRCFSHCALLRIAICCAPPRQPH